MLSSSPVISVDYVADITTLRELPRIVAPVAANPVFVELEWGEHQGSEEKMPHPGSGLSSNLN